jgi:hypothetical protein
MPPPAPPPRFRHAEITPTDITIDATPRCTPFFMPFSFISLAVLRRDYASQTADTLRIDTARWLALIFQLSAFRPASHYIIAPHIVLIDCMIAVISLGTAFIFICTSLDRATTQTYTNSHFHAFI